MPDPAFTVLGGGVAGLSAALVLARQGHRVRLIERDVVDRGVGAATDAPAWERRGIPHFLQPHAFIPRGRAELRRLLPDVADALLEAGAHDVDVARKIPSPSSRAEGDEDLQYLAVRRPLIEWALRRATLAEPGIELRDGARVTGLSIGAGRVTGVVVDGAEVDVAGGVVVDALGRRTPTATWLAAAGVGGAEGVESSDCGVVYYSRYYRQRPGFELPDGPWLLSPRGDLGYLAYASFPGDNGTFAGLLSVPNGVAEWRAFADEDVFEAAVARIPMLRMWVDPEGVEPLTGVMPMAGLRNTLRPIGSAVAAGVAPVGDASSHTDPVLAHGLAFALVHAGSLGAAFAEHADPLDALAAYAEATAPALRERYELATALDEQRRRMWVGEPVDFAHHDGDYALFSMAAGAVASMMDADLFRLFVRRIGLLDSTAVLDADLDSQRRIEARFAEASARARPAAGPSRDEMVALIAAAKRAPGGE